MLTSVDDDTNDLVVAEVDEVLESFVDSVDVISGLVVDVVFVVVVVVDFVVAAVVKNGVSVSLVTPPSLLEFDPPPLPPPPVLEFPHPPPPLLLEFPHPPPPPPVAEFDLIVVVSGVAVEVVYVLVVGVVLLVVLVVILVEGVIAFQISD